MGTKVIILPGNGCTPVLRCNWYGWLQKNLQKEGVEAILKDMPDPYEAKEVIWIPFIREELGADANSILVGHSSGAEAAMRYLENHKVKGVVLVSACYTDLGPWEEMRGNAGFISQFGSEDDPFIPMEEQTHVRDNLKVDAFFQLPKRGHFMNHDFPELLQHVLEKAKQ